MTKAPKKAPAPATPTARFTDKQPCKETGASSWDGSCLRCDAKKDDPCPMAPKKKGKRK